MSKKVTPVTDKPQERGEEYSQKRDKEFRTTFEIKKEVDRLLRAAHKNLSEANDLITENHELLTSCYSYLPDVITDYGHGDQLFQPFDSILESALARLTHVGSDLYAHGNTWRPDRDILTDAEKEEYIQDRVHNRTKWLDSESSCD